jgi:xanthine/CO dehydrogenase XdhC/CoxF family maturation factor
VNKELQEIITQFERLESAVIKTVLATVVDVKGSSYRLPGARMLIGENGEMFGTVSGGCLEVDVLERARRVRQAGAAEVFTYDTTGREDSVFSLNMGCRGIIRILLERPSPNLIDFFRKLYQSRQNGLIATLIKPETETNGQIGNRLLLAAGNIHSSDLSKEITSGILPDCLTACSEKRSKHLTTEVGEFFLEFVSPPISLLVFGAGFDAVPLCETAKILGWHVALIDHRAAFANRERFPKVDEIIISRPENVGEKVTVDENTVAVVMTHNYENDRIILRFLLNSKAVYVGALGPKRRTENVLRELSEAGENFSLQQIEKLYAPVGLDIGADTPESIAVSIIAEIKSVLENREGGFLRERKGSIYNRNGAFV